MKDILITSSVLIAAILLLRFLFRSTISRRAQYALWLLVALRLLIPASIGSSGWCVAAMTDKLPEREIAENIVTVVGGDIPQLAPRVPDPSLPEAEQRELDRVYWQEWKNEVDRTKIETGGTPITVQDIQRAVWYGGMAAMALWFLAANLRFARKLRRTRVPLDGAESRYPVYLCDDILSPCLFGLFRPAIYVTSEAARDADRLRYVIAHEETHARHLDPLWSLLRGVCLIVWWFDPLVWLAAHCSKVDCELACDEGVLARLGEAERVAYGETLLALIPVRRGGDPMLAATTMTAGKRQMKDRITRIAEHRRPVAFTGADRWRGEVETWTPTETAIALESLTGAELTYFNSEFFAPSVMDGYDQHINLHNQFLSSLYASPEDIDLFELFYCGTGRAYYGLSEDEFARVGSEECGTDKLPAAELDAVFCDNTGWHVDETKKLGLDKFQYLADYDAYYNTHGDTNYRSDVTITAGTREGDLVHLYYRDDFMGDGWKCLTLREAGENVWHFVSNLEVEKPAIPTVYPSDEPWAVMPLDGLTPYEPQTVETTLRVNDCAERMGGWSPREGVTVRLYRSTDGNTYTAVVNETRSGDTGNWRARAFLTLPETATDPEIFFFGDLFGYDGLVVCYGDYIQGSPEQGGLYGVHCRYYAFAGDGTPTLVAYVRAYHREAVRILDLDGDGTNELLANGGRASRLIFERGGKLYEADLHALLTDAFDGADAWWDTADIDANYRRMTVSGLIEGGEEPLPAFWRYLYFDGENLLIYKQPDIVHTDHVRDGVTAPPEVLADAKAETEAEARRLRESDYGERFADWLDDWCVSGLTLTRTECESYAIETYDLDMLFHASDPSKVGLAGGMYLTEDDWVGGMYNESPFLFYVVTPDGARRRLEGDASWENGPQNNYAFPATLAYLELSNGLRKPSEITGRELWRMFRYESQYETLNLLGAAGEAEYTDALDRMVADATLDGERYDVEEAISPMFSEWWESRLTDEGRAAYGYLRWLLGTE